VPAIIFGAFVLPYVAFWAQEVIPEAWMPTFEAAITGILAGGRFVVSGVSIAPSHRFLTACVLAGVQAIVSITVLWALHFSWNRGSATPVTFLSCSILSSVVICTGLWRNRPEPDNEQELPW